LKIQNSKSLIPLLACLGVVLLWFSPWWVGGRNLAPLDLLNGMMQPWRGASETGGAKNHIVSDAVDQYLVYRIVAAESYAKEGWLGWSSLTYGGTAQYANTMALYYDWTMQLHRWFSFWTAWHLGLMAQVLIAAAGMLLFLKGRSIRSLWACCGALAYAANSQFVVWIYHRWTLSAFCWVPWILWAIDRYRQGKHASWGWVPVFMAMAFLGGTLQHAAFVVLAVIAIWGEEAITHGTSVKAQTQLLSRYAIWGLLGGGLAAMMFLPCVDAFLVSNRLGLHMGMHGKSSMGIYPEGILQPILNLAAYPLQIFPSLLGRCESVDLLKLFKSELFYVIYFGSLPVLIAFIALFKRQTPMLARLLMGTGLLLPLTPLVRLLYQRLYLLFILGGIFAFTHFMESASADTKKRIFKITAWMTSCGVLIWSAISVILQMNHAEVQTLLYQKFGSSGGSFGYFHQWVHGRLDKFLADLLIWSPQQMFPLALFAIALIGLRLTASTHERLIKRGNWMVALAVVLEVSLFGYRWIVFTEPTQNPLYPVTPEVTALIQHVGKEGRVTTMIEETGNHMAVTPFIPNTLSPYGIATIGGYDSIMPNGMIRVNDPRRDAKSLGRFGVTHLITYPENPAVGAEWNRIWQSPAMALYENPTPVARYLGFRSEDEKDQFFQGQLGSNGLKLEETTHLENRREIQSPTPLRWIRIAENHAAGWEYRDQKSSTPWIPVKRAPDASMLLDLSNLPAKPTVIEMRYHPPLRRLGFIVSGATLLLMMLGEFIAIRKKIH
jgi:hypothetical protein